MSTPIRIAALAATLGVIALGGCQKKAEGPKPADFVGTWTEEAVIVSARQAATLEPPSERIRLTLNGDHTFRLEMTDAKGTPSPAAGANEGTWQLSEGRVILTVTKEGLAAKYRPAAPTEIFNITQLEDGRTAVSVMSGDEMARSLVRGG
ncbi:MAG: lipocalin family protein [Phycisphaerae bacterium]|nr:lipocalin family protein [Phycisphaerae bacterium]